MAKNPAKGVIDIDMGWDAILKGTEDFSGSYVDVGMLGEGNERTEKSGKAAKPTNADLGLIHEFGSSDGSVPSRSFIRSTLDEQAGVLEDTTRKLVTAVYDKQKIDAAGALGLLGMKLKSMIQNRIRSNIPPPLKPATIAKKGGAPSVALIDTGQMINSITYAVTEHGGEGNGGGEGGGTT